MKNTTVICLSILFSLFLTNSFADSPNVTTVTENTTADLFDAYLASIPTVINVIKTTHSGSGAAAITTKEFTFNSKDGVNTVYAIIAYPQAAGKYPAILFNHGGGGNAATQRGNVETFAARGYVTLACDLPGIAGTTNTPNSAGPWKSMTGETPRFNMNGGPQNSTLFDAMVAGLQAFNYLRSQPNVITDNIGIAGTSWGGYMTTMLSGLLGDKVKAAYASFGCGYYDAGSFWSNIIAALTPADRNVWLANLDAGRRAPHITAPYFIEEPSNDTYFWPEAVDSTLHAVPGTKNHVCMPNLNHKWITEAVTMKQLYFDYYLKGAGSPFGSIHITNKTNEKDGSLKVRMNATLPAGINIAAVQLYYSIPTANWQSRNWTPIPAQLLSGTTYTAVIPDSLVSQHVNYYAHLIDVRTVATSSDMNQASGN